MILFDIVAQFYSKTITNIQNTMKWETNLITSNYTFHQYIRYEDRSYKKSFIITGLVVIYILALFYFQITSLIEHILGSGFLLLIFLFFFEIFLRLSQNSVNYVRFVHLAKTICFGILCFAFILSIKLWLGYNPTNLNFLIGSSYQYSFLHVFFTFDVDALSINFIPIICFIFLLCFINYWYFFKTIKELFLLIFLYMSILLVFFTQNALFFYVCFELTLIPMIIMLLDGGHRPRRIKAMYYFFLLTLLGSFCLLFAFAGLYLHIGSFDFKSIYFACTLRDFNFYNFILFWSQERAGTFENAFHQGYGNAIIALIQYYTCISMFTPKYIWLPLALGFSIKIPIFPFHVWLPEAHVEAPTIGSVILASLLLKLGGYGFLRFLVHLIPSGATPGLVIFFTILCLLGVLYASLIILAQIDMKKIIAYSSVAHMNFAILGLLSYNKYGLTGCYLLLVSHCFVSAALFFAIGVLYERYHTRQIISYSGLGQLMPVFAFFFLIFNMANFAFPGTGGFGAEVLIVTGLIKGSIFIPSTTINFLIAFLSLSGVLLSAVYSMLLFTRIIFGTFIIRDEFTFNPLRFLGDLEKREYFIFSLLFFCVLLLGIYPELVLSKVHLLMDYLDLLYKKFHFLPPHFDHAQAKRF